MFPDILSNEDYENIVRAIFRSLYKEKYIQNNNTLDK